MLKSIKPPEPTVGGGGEYDMDAAGEYAGIRAGGEEGNRRELLEGGEAMSGGGGVEGVWILRKYSYFFYKKKHFYKLQKAEFYIKFIVGINQFC